MIRSFIATHHLQAAEFATKVYALLSYWLELLILELSM